MNIRKSALIICIGVQFVFISCVTQHEYITFSPAEGSGVWIDGKEYSESISNKVKIRLTFDKKEGSNIIFNLAVINNSSNDLLFNPADSYYIPLKKIYKQAEDYSIPDKLQKIKALDPEVMIYKINYDIAQENSSYKTEQAINTVFGCIGVLGGAAAAASGDDEMADDADEMIDDSAESMDDSEIMHVRRINSLKKEMAYIENNLIRKTTLFPGESKNGKIMFPADSNAKSILIRIAAGNELLDFGFNKNVVTAASGAR